MRRDLSIVATPSPSTQDLINALPDPRQRAFLNTFPKLFTIKYTSRAVNIGEHTFYDWLRLDKHFQQLWQSLKEDMVQSRIAHYEDNMHNLAFNKDSPAQTRALLTIFALKKDDPSYRDNPAPGTTNITFSVRHVDRVNRHKGEVIDGEVVRELPTGEE